MCAIKVATKQLGEKRRGPHCRFELLTILKASGFAGDSYVARTVRQPHWKALRAWSTINLVGTYNVIRLFAGGCTKLEPLEDGERGVMIFRDSVADFDVQQANSACKSGVVGMTLAMARDLAQHGIHVCTIAPGLFATQLMQPLCEPVQQSLAARIPFTSRLCKPEEFASLASYVGTNMYLSSELFRLDGALRMAPR